MSDIIQLGIELDDTKFINPLQEIEKRLIAVEKAKQEAFGDSTKVIKDGEEALKKNVAEAAKAEKEYDKLSKGTQEYSRSLKDVIKEQKIFGVSIADVQKQFNAKTAALKSTVAGLKGGTSALKLFRVALAATGIGVIVIALGSLVSLLTRTQKGIDFVNRIAASLGATIDVVVDRASTLGQALVALFSGDFQGAADLAKQAVSGVTDEIIREATAANELEQRNQNLRDSQRELNVEYAKTQARIEELRNASRDETKSQQERIQALQEAQRLETQLEEKRVALARENLDIIEKRNALGESLADDLDAQAEAEIILFNIQADTDRKRRRDFQQLQSLQRQAAQEAKAAQEAERKRIEEINSELEKQLGLLGQRVASVEFEGLDQFEKLKRERQLAIEEVEKLRDTLQETAEQAGKQVDITDDIQTLFDAIEREYVRGFNKLAGVEGLETQSITPFEIDNDVDIDDLSNRIAKPFEVASGKAELTVGESLQKFKDSILDKLGVSEDELQPLFSALSGVFQSISQGILDNTNLQIEQQEGIIERLNLQIEETEDALDRELELKKIGRANDFDDLKKRLEQEQKQREEAEAKRLALEKEVARERLLIESLQQGASLATAAAQVFAAESKKGLLGIAFAITAITTIFTTFKKFKNLAKQDVPTLREGLNPYHSTDSKGKGLLIQGPSHERGGVPLIHGGRLYEAEGGEILVGTRVSKLNADFLNNLNRGRYDNIDMLAVAENARKMGRLTMSAASGIQKSQAKYSQLKASEERKLMETAYRNAAMEAAKYIVNGNKQNLLLKPDKTPLPDGRILEERYNEKGDKTGTIIRELPKK